MSILGIFFATTSMAWAQTCSVNCLDVYSIVLQDLGTSIQGTVKLIDDEGTAGGARSAVVHGVWTRPDGTTFDQYDVIGTRLRAEFRLYTAGEPGTYTLTVAGATKTGYTFDPASDTPLSETIQIGDPTNESPIAVANADITAGSVPLVVNFDSLGSTDPDGTVTGYEWTFGDGTASTEVDPQHVYETVGNYTATLTVTDDMGATASRSLSIGAAENIAGCTLNCISINGISMSYSAKVGKVKGRVLLVDENGGPIDAAKVHAEWTLPDTSTVNQSRKVKNKSRVTFGVPADTAGSYTLTIVEISKTGYTFDLDNSKVLNGTIAITP